MKKDIYKKVVKWKKNPTWSDILGGGAFIIIALAVYSIYLVKYFITTALTSLMILMMLFGLTLILKGKGECRKVSYIKIKSKMKQ